MGMVWARESTVLIRTSWLTCPRVLITLAATAMAETIDLSLTFPSARVIVVLNVEALFVNGVARRSMHKVGFAHHHG